MGHPWYAFYPADYRNKTSGLTMVQDSAYRRLMDEYYLTGEPLPANAEILLRICRAFADDEKAAVLFVLEKYFVEGDDGWHHLRIDEEIIKRAELSEKRANAGKNGALKTNSGKSANAGNKKRQLPTQSQPQSQSNPSLRSGSPEPPVIALPTNRFEARGEEIGVSQTQVDDYAITFPAVDVPQQLREMRRWLMDNPERRKTATGMPKFINRWLSKEQDKGTANVSNFSQKRGSATNQHLDGIAALASDLRARRTG